MRTKGSKVLPFFRMIDVKLSDAALIWIRCKMIDSTRGSDSDLTLPDQLERHKNAGYDFLFIQNSRLGHHDPNQMDDALFECRFYGARRL